MTRLEDGELAALVRAAGAGSTAAVTMMLDLGFPIGTRGDEGGTSLHAAAYAGSTAVVRLLLDRGADLEALDETWHSSPLGWAVVGSAYRPTTNPDTDWAGTVRMLIEAGASIRAIALDAEDPMQPSTEVTELLRSFGVGAD